MPEATKVCSVVTLGEGLPVIKSHDHLKKGLREIAWQIKSIKSDSS